jgi:TatD DNase family protein
MLGFFVFGTSMWFDSHFHLDAVVNTWQPESVSGGLAVGVDSDDWLLTRNRLKLLSGDWRQAVGFHPWVARDDLPWSQLVSWLSDNTSLALGEIGLDGSPARRGNLLLQWDAFVRQVALAHEGDRVMSLHLVNDDERGYQWIRQHRNSRGIVHGFTGSLKQALGWQALGFYIGIGERLLDNMTDKRQQLLNGLDKSLVLLETDAPYGISRDEVRTPDSVVTSGQQLALFWNVSVLDVEMICQNNWLRLWDKNV